MSKTEKNEAPPRKTRKTTIYIDEQLWERVQLAAIRHPRYRSLRRVSKLVEDAIREYLAKLEHELEA